MKRLLLTILALLVLPICSFAQTNTAAGNLTAASASCLATNCTTLRFYPNTISATITLSGTWSATVQFEVSGDFGNTFVAAPGTASSTSNGSTQFGVGGYTNIRARVSAFTSGTVVVTVVGATQSVSNVTTIVNGGAGGPLATPNLSSWYFATNCNNATNCTAIKADGAILTDCTTVNTSSTVTCPDAIFTASDVGKSAWATSLGTGNGLAINALISCPISTIASVNSPTSITLTAANDCTSSLTGNAAFFFGTDDGATIAAAMAANVANFVFSVGNAKVPAISRIFVSQGFGNTLASSPVTNISPFITISGGAAATSAAYFVIMPNFNWAGCTGNNGTLSNVCFGAKAINMNYLSFGGFGLNGTGACPAAAQAKTVVAPATLVNQNYELNLNGICPGTLNLAGIEIDGLDSTLEWGGAIHVGTASCVVGGVGVSGFYNDCTNDGSTVTGNACASATLNQCVGLWVKPAAQYQDFGSVWLENAVNQGNFTSRASHFYGGGTFWALINSNSGGVARHYSDGDFFNESGSPAISTSFGILSDFGAQVYLHNSTVKAGAAGTVIQTNNDGAVVTIYDQCGNSFSGGTIFTNTANAGNVEGTCSAGGTKLATSNVGLTSGWGTSSVASVAPFSNSHRGRFTITGAAGSPSPTLTLTFPTAYPLIAPASCNLYENTTDIATLTSVASGTPTLTNVVFTFAGTPGAATYIFDYECGP